jgi:hypothetical protein
VTDLQERADQLLESLIEALSTEEQALALALLANRTATRLHNLSRAEAQARKGQDSWPSWAGLQNVARALVLQTSTCRDLAARLAGRRA